MKAGPYGVRRFCPPGARPDCFEVFDRRNGNCASFGTYRYLAERKARAWNRGWREDPSKHPPTAARPK